MSWKLEQLDDFSGARAGGAAEGSSLEALLRVRVAEPSRPRVPQLAAVCPKVRPGTGVLAQLAHAAVAPTPRAAISRLVGPRHLVLSVATVKHHQIRVVRGSFGRDPSANGDIEFVQMFRRCGIYSNEERYKRLTRSPDSRCFNCFTELTSTSLFASFIEKPFFFFNFYFPKCGALANE